MTDIDAEKQVARDAAEAVRAAFHAEHAGAGAAVATLALRHADRIGLGEKGRKASVFWSMGTEIDTKPLIWSLDAMGWRVLLPVVEKRGLPLRFRCWKPGEPLVSGGFGTSVPAPDAEEADPDVLFVPLLAFDRKGYRLGYGGGFYDRTLEKLRKSGSPVTVGLAFSAQRVDTVPRGPHDQPLDWIVTEDGLEKFPL